EVVDPMTDARDLANVLLRRIALGPRLRNRRDEIAAVADRDADRRELLSEAGNAHRRRSHVHAAPPAAEIQRRADDLDGPRRHAPAAPVRDLASDSTSSSQSGLNWTVAPRARISASSDSSRK